MLSIVPGNIPAAVTNNNKYRSSNNEDKNKC